MPHNIEQPVFVGYLYFISPSEIYTHIEPGVIRVTDLYIGSLHHKEDILGFMALAPADVDVNEDTLWVNYVYIRDETGKIHTLPIDVFKEHVTSYEVQPRKHKKHRKHRR